MWGNHPVFCIEVSRGSRGDGGVWRGEEVMKLRDWRPAAGWSKPLKELQLCFHLHRHTWNLLAAHGKMAEQKILGIYENKSKITLTNAKWLFIRKNWQAKDVSSNSHDYFSGTDFLILQCPKFIPLGRIAFVALFISKWPDTNIGKIIWVLSNWTVGGYWCCTCRWLWHKK